MLKSKTQTLKLSRWLPKRREIKNIGREGPFQFIVGMKLTQVMLPLSPMMP